MSDIAPAGTTLQGAPPAPTEPGHPLVLTEEIMLVMGMVADLRRRIEAAPVDAAIGEATRAVVRSAMVDLGEIEGRFLPKIAWTEDGTAVCSGCGSSELVSTEDLAVWWDQADVVDPEPGVVYMDGYRNDDGSGSGVQKPRLDCAKCYRPHSQDGVKVEYC